MKLLWLFVCLLPGVALAAEHQETLADNISQIDIAIPAVVQVEHSEHPSLMIDADQKLLELIEVVRDGSRVTVKKQHSWLHDMDNELSDIRITMGVKQLDAVGLSGSGRIELADFSGEDLTLAIDGSGSISTRTLAYNAFDLALHGSGELTLEVSENTRSVDVVVAGSGKVSGRGHTKKLDASLTGSGQIAATHLAADSVDAVLTGSGNMDLNIEQKLDAVITGSGHIVYTGHPAVELQTIGSGSVQQR